MTQITKNMTDNTAHIYWHHAECMSGDAGFRLIQLVSHQGKVIASETYHIKEGFKREQERLHSLVAGNGSFPRGDYDGPVDAHSRPVETV